ncbi:SPOR domain-containing protein [Psychrobacter sp. I-STPA10]|uniref:SPOR domain-containing protein n=1 Tax=Psychrobacter sp. I-STPA10 TaxID=2585769 RepID=UPI001E4FB64E|nr:SPOR domain-containing protein [Psychrobacter sp. I-STPA10]
MLAKKPKGATQKQNSGSGIAGLIWMFVGAILTLMIGLFLYLWNPFDMGQTDTQAEPRVVQPKVNTDQDNEYEFYDLLPEQQITNIPDEAIIVDRPPQEEQVDSLEPDVVVLVPIPQNEQAEADSNTDNSQSNDNRNNQNFGISEETILNPLPEQEPTRTRVPRNEIVVVEEQETYDGTDASSNTSGSNTNNSANNHTNSNAATTTRSTTPQRTYILQINSYTNADEADRRRAQVLMAGVDAKVIKNETANGQTIYQVISNKMTNRQSVVSAQQKLQNNGIDSLIVEQRR